ncbi:hypothetical protein EYZ11_003374 [Aspergillus tanneri]|uniref:G-patch domain-containing protein n=1 Tax=Aspergillus tanneri TaxID=1220188 RepID=A0A4S3JNC3_9EURO|nr:uncharacterized protein ATNIH1004_003101 [Aspergillus tanneri]KAA8650415.1 hypothetical protein ATNIH1004_003101 [Aspergillus tanneri]THC97159.1 hypothetical protein EYZ11_003374 [Aspergillus tanneri]
MTPDDDEDYFVSPEDQRVFGAGISRKRVQFVRSSDHELNTTTGTSSAPTPSTPSGSTIANKYLSIVLPKSDQGPNTFDIPQDRDRERDRERDRAEAEIEVTAEVQSAPSSPSGSRRPLRCQVCHLPLRGTGTGTLNESSTTQDRDRLHEASLAHQVCLTHSHPPSHLDRTRHGLRYLSAYGWDPDSRLGLGAPGREGIREPLKGRLKVDTVGLGADIDREYGDGRKLKQVARPAKIQKLDAKQVRKGHAEMRKRGDRLREMFYQNDDVQRYLAGEG